ncbi:MAG: tetratricopeptide repeat protein [Verrucomicrobiota bacterium]
MLLLSASLCLRASASSPAALEQAIAALDEGVPQVAIIKLKEQLATPLEMDARKLAKTKLAEALLTAGLLDDALRQVRDPEVAAPMLEARIDAAQGHWNEALALYEAAKEEPGAVLGKAECLYKLGRIQEAMTTLEERPATGENAQLRLAELYLEQNQNKKCEKLLKSIRPCSEASRKWKLYLEARWLLGQGHAAPAFGRFEELSSDPKNVTANLIAGATLGMTQARTDLSGLAAADDLLEQFIWKYPENEHLESIFRKLDEVYSGEANSSRSELEKWAEREPARRAGFACYFLAKAWLREGKQEQGLRALEAFGERFPKHPILADALLMQGGILANEGRFGPAQETLEAAMRAARDDQQLAEIEIASASVHFRAGEYVLAATVFRSAGERSPALWERAVYNSALAWLHQGNYTRFMQDYRELSQRLPESTFRRDLILEEGLLQARQGDPRATAILQQFIRDFPENPRVAEARLALAELAFAKNDSVQASQYLAAVNQAPAPTQTAEQSDYLSIFVAESAKPCDDDKVIALCRAFIDQHPGAKRVAEVRMKLGQVFFRKEDFANAHTQFETLARETPNSPLAETALFLAGEAAIKSMSDGGIDQAIELFEEVAQANGPLKFHARLQQAVAQNRLGKENEAIILYEAILKGNPPSEVRFAAMAGKADNLSRMGEKNPTAREQALALYGELAASEGVPAIWRNQALYKKGRCLAQLGKTAEALTIYYDVIAAGVAKPEEYFWFYKAGFDAGRLCESQEQWKSAIAIYQKMSVLNGPRLAEAKARMTQLRLEHFIWD